jgi:hypothetical protein
VIGTDAGQTLGVDDSADVGIGVCGPVCPEAICDFPVDDGGSQGALAIIVGWLQQIWRIKGGQQLLAGVGGLAQQCAGHVAVGPSAEDFADLVLQAPPFAGDGAGRECAEMSPECEGIAHPEFEPERRRIVADLQSIGDVADQIRQTGLMALAVTLLGAITIRGAERRAMTTHHISKHLGRPTEGRLVKHNPIRAEHPVLGVDALDPHAHLITGHGGRLAQARQDRGSLPVERRPRPIKDVAQRALAAGHNRQDRRQINRIMGPYHFTQGIRREPMPATGATGRAVLDDPIRLLGQGPEAALVTGLGAAWLRTHPLLMNATTSFGIPTISKCKCRIFGG